MIMDRTDKLQPSFDSLPEDLVVEIIAHVASTSTNALHDLANIQRTCKMLEVAVDDRLVFQHVFLTKAYSWKFSMKYADFFNRCLEAGNAHANYIQGTMDYFSKNRRAESGFSHLTTAAKMGLLEAIYLLGIIYFSDESTRTTGIELLNKVDNDPLYPSSSIKKCRERSKHLLSTMWRNKIFGQQYFPCAESKCVNPVVKIGWDIRSFCSDICKWGYEYNEFCKFL